MGRQNFNQGKGTRGSSRGSTPRISQSLLIAVWKQACNSPSRIARRRITGIVIDDTAPGVMHHPEYELGGNDWNNDWELAPDGSLVWTWS